jgi:hypothetical protein
MIEVLGRELSAISQHERMWPILLDQFITIAQLQFPTYARQVITTLFTRSAECKMPVAVWEQSISKLAWSDISPELASELASWISDFMWKLRNRRQVCTAYAVQLKLQSSLELMSCWPKRHSEITVRTLDAIHRSLSATAVPLFGYVTGQRCAAEEWRSHSTQSMLGVLVYHGIAVDHQHTGWKQCVRSVECSTGATRYRHGVCIELC